MSRTVRLRFTVPRDRQDAFEGWLWSAGAGGVEHDEVAPRDAAALAGWIYFPTREAPDDASRSVLTSWCPGAELGVPEPVTERDWLEPWRSRSRPIEIGAGFVVDPREPGEVDSPYPPGSRRLLRLPARTAFGVGSHESTRLALELLERIGCAGLRVLDVGCGTGILAFAARLLGAREVVAFDIDPAAALLVGQYASLNGFAPIPVFAGSLAALAIEEGSSPREPFGLALVNVIPAEIGPELSRLAGCLGTRGRAIFSGILLDRQEEARSLIARHGFRATESRSAGEWVALVAELGG